VSTDEQAKNEEGSIRNQLAACRRHVDKLNDDQNGRWGKVVDEYVDEGYSGKDLNRPALRRLLVDIKKGLIDTVIMTEISRLSRSKKDWLDLLQFFQDHGVEFITLRQKFDLSTAMGRMVLSLMIEFSQLEREQIAERVTAGAKERRRRGLYTGGPIPFGLERTDRKGHLIRSASKGVIAGSILDVLLNEGGSLRNTCRIINANGWLRDTDGPWNFQALAHWIRNPHVAGQVELNPKNKSKDPSTLQDNDRYELIEAVWEPVADREKLMAARKLLDENFTRLKVSTWKDHEYLLTNLIECHHGNKFTGGSGKGRSGQKYAYYKHPNRTKCSCGIGRVPAQKVEQLVMRELKKLIQAPQLLKELCAEANKKAAATQPNYDELIRAEKKRADGVTNQLDKITDEVLSATGSEEKQMWRDKAFRLQTERTNIEKQITYFESLKKQKPEQVSASMIEAALSKLGDGFKGLPVAARLRIIKGVLANVRINKDYSITLSVKNPNLLDLEKSETSVIMGAIGLPKEINGSEGGTRTPDPAVNSRLLYQLSYF
jgi:site-specific DNA recombinase